ncbi:hypothetical protein [Anaerotignum sp.]|uniref:hypothetical protein n=1 Tax=Anaerotignum sp. TaxID=2039241 RepID=UPI002A91EB04|nr:hypothetical protein [Anaerotignum sp.]MCI7658238.1 hypothetical protein [Clostridia bacterium]MDY5416260.1 hypothetical protein [Anaerotignum sp.]
MWIYFVLLAIFFYLIFRKGYIKIVLIMASSISLATFIGTYAYFQFPLELCVFQTIVTFIIWYTILQIIYGIIRNYKKSAPK